MLPPEEHGKPVVRIPDSCERLPGQIPLPVIKKGDNAKSQVVQHRAVVKKLNGRVAAKDQCMKDVREKFAKGQP